MVSTQRDKMICENLGLVHSLAHRFTNRGVEYDDLYQSGCVGLIKAVDNFNKELGFSFSTYAVPVIMGEIKRLFRDGGAIKVSRSIKEKAVIVQATREAFVNKEGGEPTISELSSLSGFGEEELCEILNALAPVMSLSIENEDGTNEYEVPFDDTDNILERLNIKTAVSTLSNQEILLVKYRFYEGKTQTETAHLLGISQVQVSRREKALLNKLRLKLSA